MNNIDEAFPEEVAAFGAAQVWAAFHWVCEHQVIAGHTTLGQAKQLTRERLHTGAPGPLADPPADGRSRG